MIYLPCGHTISDSELLSLAGSVLGRRQTPHGGRKPKLALGRKPLPLPRGSAKAKSQR